MHNIQIGKLSVHVFATFIIAFVFFFSLAKITPHPVLTVNGGSHIGLIYSIVFKKSFEIIGGPADTSSFQGKYYSNKPPGLAFAVATPYMIYNKLTEKNLDLSIEEQKVLEFLRMANMTISKEKQKIFEFLKVFNVLLSSLSVVLVLLLLTTFDLSLTSVYIGVIAAFCGTIYPAYCIFATSIPLSVFLCLLVILTYRLYKKTRQRSFFLISTVCISYASIVDYSNIFFLIPIAVLLIKQIKDAPKLIFFSIPSLFPLLLIIVYNYLIFGEFFVLSYSY